MPEAQQAASASARMDSAGSSAHKSSAHWSDTDRELQARPTRHKARSVPLAASASTWDAPTPLGLTARQLQLQGRAHAQQQKVSNPCAHVAVARTRASRGIARDRTRPARSMHWISSTYQWRWRQWRRRALGALLDLLARRSCVVVRVLCSRHSTPRWARNAQLYRRRHRNRAATIKRIGVDADGIILALITGELRVT